MTWILITGATGGIGRDAALRLAGGGHRVIATGRSNEKIAALSAEASRRGVSLATARLDVCDPESVESASGEVAELTGGYGVDVVINNAGYGEMCPVSQCSHARAERMFDTNLLGAARVIRAFVPAMRERGRGRVINISSVLGRLSIPLQGVYAATKHALQAMSDALRLELAPFGVKVIVIEPGAVDTAFNDVAFQALDELRDDVDWGRAARRMRAFEGRYRSTAARPEVISAAIERACVSPEPERRVTVPVSARIQLEAGRLAPPAVMETLTRVVMGLGGERRAPAAPTGVALVTGAAGGIGRAACFSLSKMRLRVIATDVDERALAEVAAHANEQRLAIETRVMDVTDDASVERVARDYELDVLVNNAGYAEVGPIELAQDAAWRDQLSVNVLGMLRVTRAFAPSMRRRRRGRIVNVSSVVGRVTFPFLGLYCASKHALEALTTAMRAELGAFGVHVCAVQPAAIRTGFSVTAKKTSERYSLGTSPYSAGEERMDEVTERLVEVGGEASDVARAIARAVRSPRPEARYQTPFSAWLAVRTLPWLPQRWTDAGMARFIGIDGG